MSEWINIEEKLPPEHCVLIFKVKGANVKGIRYTNEDGQPEYKNLSKRNFMAEIIDPTHWKIDQ